MLERAENWTPPDGLGYSSLRPVRVNGAGKAMLAAAVCLLIAGVVAAFFLDRSSRRQNVEAQLLADQGVQTQAEITRVWRTGGNAKNRNAEARNRVSYTFEHAGGRYSRSTQAPYNIWRNLRAGGSLTVRYVPTQPEISHPVDWDNRPLARWFPFLIGGMLIFMAPLMILPLRRQYLLLCEGRPAPGKITEIKKSDKTLTVKYEFRLMSGGIATGKASVSKAPVEPLCVIYEPDNPRRNALYPMCLVKLEGASDARKRK
ncbi:MAG: DUF3592 domain-containing protein [Candidatus Solibacter sp.]